MMIEIKPVLFSLIVGHEVLCLLETVGVIAAAIRIDERENTRGNRTRFAATSATSEVNLD